MNNLLQKIIDEGYTPSVSEVRDWITDYPASVIPLVALLKDGISDENDENICTLLFRLAASYTDRNDFHDVVGENAYRFVGFYPTKSVSTPTTEATIDSFLERFGNPDPAETEILTKMIFNPMPDYASVLAAEEKQSVPTDEQQMDKTTQRINSYIAASKGNPKKDTIPYQTQQKSRPIESSDNHACVENDEIKTPRKTETAGASLSEGLAMLMIKNGNYRKALEIITAISLNNPEKSIYFADQIRFLRKLIIIDSKKQ